MIHLAAAILATWRMKRQCPKCHREQIVAKSHANQAVACRFCRALIPPSKRPDRLF